MAEIELMTLENTEITIKSHQKLAKNDPAPGIIDSKMAPNDPTTVSDAAPTAVVTTLPAALVIGSTTFLTPSANWSENSDLTLNFP